MVADDICIIQACRMCGSVRKSEVIDLGMSPIGNDLFADRSSALGAINYPLVLEQCIDCKHFQLKHSVSPHKLYQSNYSYLSGISKVFVRHLADYASEMVHEFSLVGKLVVDIGSNDGTCLKQFKDLGASVIGVDPSDIPVEIARANGINSIRGFFDVETALVIKKDYGEAQLVTSHNVLAHVSDLKVVLEAVGIILAEDGIFCFEIGHFLSVFRNRYFDTIYHEHLDYHTLQPWMLLLEANGLTVVSVALVEPQGGSLRIFARKSATLDEREINRKAINKVLRLESSVGVYELSGARAWSIQLNNLKNRVRTFLNDEVDNKSRIAAFGWPTKAATFCSFFGLQDIPIEMVFEDNEQKIGKFAPRFGWPVVRTDPEKLQIYDIIIVFAWNFADDIAKTNTKYLSGNGKFVVFLPDIRVL